MIGKFSDTNSRRSNTEEEVKSCYDRSNKDKDELDTQNEDTQVEREARSRITKSRTPTSSASAIPLTNDHPIQFRVQQKPPGYNQRAQEGFLVSNHEQATVPLATTKTTKRKNYKAAWLHSRRTQGRVPDWQSRAGHCPSCKNEKRPKSPSPKTRTRRGP